MKILYGVQATGNGHISRARAMNKHLKALGIEVDYVFSGRERSKFFDMEEFGDWRCLRGLTFFHDAGNLKILSTIKNNNIIEFMRDVKKLSLDDYDLILTDYEPVTAWAAKFAKRYSVGVGHQYAFNCKVPRRGDDYISSAIMRNFAPTSEGLGLHWHHFNQAILPPIADTPEAPAISDPNKILVYLGFESPEEVISLLEPFEEYLFVFYGPFSQYESRGHIQLKPLSREGFKQDLASCGGVLCNAGFELSSEALQLGKKLLIKPLRGQLEQLSNAKALVDLGLGMTMDTLDPSIIKTWLSEWEGKRVNYPDVAQAIANWVLKRGWENPDMKKQLIEDLWAQTDAPGIASFAQSPKPQLAPESLPRSKAPA